MATFIEPADDDARRLSAAIHDGDHAALGELLGSRPELATAYVGDAHQARTALHVATDWPGHFPGVGTTVELLVAAGADLDAPFVGTHGETALHWAASSGDLVAIDALVAAGADLDAPGGVLTGGSPLDDAVIFDLLDGARRLVAAGATVVLFHAAALGLDERVAELAPDADPQHLTASLWHACKHGNTTSAALLLGAGADPAFDGWDGVDTLAAARDSGDADLLALVAAHLDDETGRAPGR